MSLTSLLRYNTELKALFAELPSLKSLYKTKNDDMIPFPPHASANIQVKRPAPPNTIIGHAYDYWLRAYVQRLNHQHKEKSGYDLTASVTVKMLSSSNTELHHSFEQIITRRNQYIKRMKEDDEQLIRDCMVLGNLDVYYRAGYAPEHGFHTISEDDIEDLFRLTEVTKQVASFFTVQDKLLCNPEFGLASLLVGGADADLIMDDTLIEIKTESSFGYRAAHVRQLIAYYLLSRLTPSFDADINKLAVFNPRYGRFNYLEIADIEKEVDMDNFMDRFVTIICNPSFAEDNNRATPALKQIQQEIQQVYRRISTDR